MENREVWHSLLAQIQLMVSPFQFNTWFKNTELGGIDNGIATIYVANSFVKEWLEKNFSKTILEILKKKSPKVKTIRFEVEKKKKNSSESNIVLSKAYPKQTDFESFKKIKEANLNARYSFSNFIVGSFNELAFAASQAVCQNPGKIYNPLFIYGGVGLGKTHILQASGNEILNTKREINVRYFQTQFFVSEVIMAIKNRDIENFRKKMQNIDVLIVDDIQFLAGKERTQEEFFYIFNLLYEKNKQIIISSDRSPREIPALTERLKSRFEGGMLADISFPDYESRLAILKAKVLEKNIEIEESVLDFIAKNIKRNIRELEGVLNLLTCKFNLEKNKKIDLDTVYAFLKKYIEKPKKIVNSKIIIKEVADFYCLKEKDLLSSCRREDIVKPRQIAMYLIREELGSSLTSIAKLFGGKDHTTVMYSFNKILEKIQKDEQTRNEINLLKERIFS